MLKQTIKKWNQAIESYGANNTNEAINLLTSVDPTSKINYNVGVMCIKISNYSKAVDYFSRSVELDKYLAISYFMRGVAYHMSGDTSHAIVDYDEAISKLRGHEYIDYKQLGLDCRLLLAEILYNKALALGRAGGAVVSQAVSCSAQPSDAGFKDLCRRLQSGDTSLQTRTIPLNLLFKPPNVSDGPSSGKGSYGGGSSSSKSSSSTSSASVSSSPPGNYTLRTAPPKPPTPTPSTTTTTTTTASKPSTIPKPPTVPSKKLPSRPISMAQEEKITLKVFYNDRRLIQITHPYTFKQLQQKINLKFEIDVENSGISINYQSSDDQYYPINAQSDLDYVLSYEINELHLFTPENGSGSTTSSSTSSPTMKSTSALKTSTSPSSYSSYSPPTKTGGTTYSSSSSSLTRSTAKKLTQSSSPAVAIPSKSFTGFKPTGPSSLPNKKFGNGAQSADDSIYKVMYTPNGEKFYLNTETGESLWTTP